MKKESDKMEPSERKELRGKLLKELYDHNFKKYGEPLNLNKDKLDIETKLAYEYLAEKNMITIKAFSGHNLHYKITAYGIDMVENKQIIM